MASELVRSVVKKETYTTKKGVECQILEFKDGGKRYQVFLPIPAEDGTVSSPFVLSSTDYAAQKANEIADLKEQLAELKKRLS